jgi:hypothetical protein
MAYSFPLLVALALGQAGSTSTPSAGAIAEKFLTDLSSRIVSYDVTYDVEWRHFFEWKIEKNRATHGRLLTTPTRRMLRFRHLYQAGQYRVDTLDPASGEVIESCVGTLSGDARILNQREGRASITRPQLEVFSNSTDYRVPFLHAFGRLPHWLIVRERAAQVTPLPDGARPTELKIAPLLGNNVSLGQFGFRLFIDHEAGVVWKESITRSNNGASVPYSDHEIVEWKRLPGGASVPTKIVSIDYATAPEFVGVKMSEFLLTVDVTRSTWNEPLDQQTLALEFPAGIRVHDQIRNVVYTQGQPDPRVHLDRLAQSAAQLAQNPIRSETLLAAAPWWQSTPAIIAYVVLAFALVYIIIRRRRLAAE